MSFITVTIEKAMEFRQAYKPINSELNNQIWFHDNIDKKNQDAILRAYADMQRRCININGANYNDCNNGSNVKEFIFNSLYSFIEKIRLNQIENFNAAHNAFCSEITGNYSNNENQKKGSITYGLAQKLINMTMKYFYNEVLINNDFSYLPNNIYHHFHCPVDSLILENLIHIDAPHWPEITEKDGTWYYQKILWSNFEKDNYLSFQQKFNDSLLDGFFPLEAEYHTWSKFCLVTNETVRFFNLMGNCSQLLKGKVFQSNYININN